MTRPVKKMPTPLGIGAGQTATVQLPLGLTYHRFYIRMNVDVSGTATDVAVADWGTYIDEIRLIVDGDVKWQMDAADLVKMNQFYGQTMVAGVLPIFLSRPWMRTLGGEDQTAYGTAAGSIDNFAMEIDLKTGITINSLNVYATQSVGVPFGPHLRIQKYVHNQGLTGPAEISNITRGNYSMCALHLNTAAITNVEVEVNNRQWLDFDKAIRNAHYELSGRTVQAGFTHIDFMAENRIGEAMPMNVSDFRLKLDFTATGNVSIYAESIAPA